MNRFPQEQGSENSRSGGGRRLSSTRMLQSAQGRNTTGSVAIRSFADLTQSCPHTGHFMLLIIQVPGYKCFQTQPAATWLAGREDAEEELQCSGPEGIRTHDRPVMSRAL